MTVKELRAEIRDKLEAELNDSYVVAVVMEVLEEYDISQVINE